MALIGNASVLNKSAGKWLTGSTGHAQARPATNRPGDWRKFSLQDRSNGTGTILALVANPQGYYPPGAWALPTTAGDLSSHEIATGSCTATATIVAGRALAGASDGTSTTTATGALVVSGSGAAAGSSTATGSVIAALNGAASTAATSTATAAATAKGHASSTASGSSTATALRYALGHLAGESSPFTALSPQSLAESVMGAIVESGLSVREALQVIAAATAGKVSGAETTTIVFRDTADTKDRITATVDASGNRTAIVLDTDG